MTYTTWETLEMVRGYRAAQDGQPLTNWETEGWKAGWWLYLKKPT